MNQFITTWRSRKDKEMKRDMAKLCGEIGVAIVAVVILYIFANTLLGLN